MDDGIRINKFLAEAGLCSRREADRWVEAGRVSIARSGNAEALEKALAGSRVMNTDVVYLDGKPAQGKTKNIYLAYHKPRGVECTEDPSNPDNLTAAVDYPERVFSVGRLDKFSEGLLLLTNDGDVVNRLLRGRHGVEKEYHVELNGEIDPDRLDRLREGIELVGRDTLPCEIERLGPRLYRFVLVEGINRQIRRMAEFADLKVNRLVRVRFGAIRMGDLKPGTIRALTDAESSWIIAQR